MSQTLSLGYGLAFEELYQHDGLIKLDQAFIHQLKETDVELHNRLVEARANPEAINTKDISNLLIDVAPHLEDFLAQLFGIPKDVAKLAAEHHELANIYSCKRLFVQRQALKKYKEEEALTWSEYDGRILEQKIVDLIGQPLNEISYSNAVTSWMENKDQYETALDLAARYAAWAVYTVAGQKAHRVGVLFKLPKKLDVMHLVPVETVLIDGITVKRLPKHDLRYREGFALTDNGGTLEQVLDDANYCIYCHNQGKDSCSKGLKEKDGSFKKTPLQVNQAGCPLEEKISEMNLLKSQGVSLGALAMVAVDNPLCAATGHRICNDCMKSCIYQKQEPVNIPRTETGVLMDVLKLPYGFEIYSLLTRWNPLNLTRPLPRPTTDYKVLVVGLGPAGFNLSHHLLNEGHTVVAVDGLKIEPVDPNISGVNQDGSRAKFNPVRDLDEIFESLDTRVLAGFGGVAEYGITVRWNKNFLKVIRLLLERRQHFAMYGGVRFGSTITYEDARHYGFDHIALAMGAGRPTLIDIPNAVARGVRTASDFLMSLQLSGAGKKESIANLQLRLPVVVIGGGLTAVDTATESLAYYPLQVEKFYSRYEVLVKKDGIEKVRNRWNEEETIIADEFIEHAKAIQLEREAAREEGREPDILSLLNQWGGVKIAYRKTLEDAPAYRLNHEEVELAMQEGLELCENATPLAVELDRFGHASGLKVSIKTADTEEMIVMPARTVFMAAGTNPNTVLQREDPIHFEVHGKYFKAIDECGNHVVPEPNTSKPSEVQVLMHRSEDEKYISYFGDLHPSFVGNVVKAMGAAKQGYPIISKILQKAKPLNTLSSDMFITFMNQELRATIHHVERLTPNIVEVVVKAPAAARKFHPGQFYRLQNFEMNAKVVDDAHHHRTRLAMEGLALTGAWVDKEQGLLSTIVLEMGGSSNLCMELQPNEPVILMGPTGTPTHTPGGETVLLVGGGLGNAVLFSIGKALKEAGSKVLYVAGYKKSQDRYKVKEIEEASDVIIWACDEAIFTPEREQDKAFHGNIVQAIEAYGAGRLGKIEIPLSDVQRMVVIGSDRMMAAVQQARYGVLQPFLNPKHLAIGSINSPMQCMMKEICAQCLQRHVDPVTGKETYVYSCFNQDQCLDQVDFAHLNERLKQNNVQEKLTAQWLSHVMSL